MEKVNASLEGLQLPVSLISRIFPRTPTTSIRCYGDDVASGNNVEIVTQEQSMN